MRFPLPAGYFSSVDLSPAKRHEYQELVRSRVSTMLADEIRYAERRAQQQPIVPAKEWKALSPIGELNVYQRRRNGRSDREIAEDENFPEGRAAVMHKNKGIVANGRVKGTIEDMLYGMSATTQGDMMTGLAFTAPPADSVLLAVVEQATPEDPLRSAELLWILTAIPMIKQRDVCYLKATGVERDRNGTYGYMILHSVDVPECPPFDRSAKVIRAKMFFSCLFREITPGYVDVVARGIFDLSGNEMLKVLLQGAAKSLLGGLLKGADCGKAKKLTLLARSNGGRRHAVIPKDAVCSVCISSQKMLQRRRLVSCQVCGVIVCSNCKAKGTVAFLGRRKPCAKIDCCRTCEQQAAAITGVRPAEPECIVVADYYCSKASSSPCSSSSGRSAVATVLTTPQLDSSSRRQPQETSTRSKTDEWIKQHELKSLSSEAGQTNSSVGVMTNSTVDDSCAGFDFGDVCISGTFSDVNSSEGYYDDQEREPEPGQTVLPELMKEYATISSEEEPPTSGVKPWAERHRIYADDFKRGDPPSARRRPDNLYEWMKDLQLSANEAYKMTQARDRKSVV